VPLIPSLIPEDIGTLGAGSFSNTGPAFDCAIGGIPFLFANTPQDPNLRETADFKRQQFDNSTEAGEQSLSRWWIRSQASWHNGAGQLYIEPSGGQDEFSRTRFDSSKNVNVWTPGAVTRLPDTSTIVATSTPSVMVAVTKGGVDYAIVASGTALTAWSSATGTASTYTWGGSGTILALVTDGSSYYAADATGIYKGPVDGGSSGTLIWNTGSGNVTLGWTKQRLMAGIANKVYELSGAGPTLPTAKYTHPDTTWRWSAFAEGPTAVMAAGLSGGNSAVVKFALDSQGATPTLSGGGATAINMPEGEQIISMIDYLGSFLAIGTNTGLWIASYDQFQGNATLGPKTLDFGVAIKGLTGRGRFVYATASRQIDGESGLFRVDLGAVVDKAGHMAYASDLICPTAQTGDAVAVALLPISQRVVFAVTGLGVAKEGAGPGTAREA
jgi:hypothetical protein